MPQLLNVGWSRRMGAGRASGAFLPSDLTGLKLWCRFNSGITETGSGVSQWDDVSGNGNHLLQGTDAARPPKQADGSILFSGVNDYLKAASFTLVQPETVYLLVKQVSWASAEYIFDGETTNSGMVRQVSGGSSPDIESYAGGILGPDGNLAVGTYGIICAVFNGASSILQVDDNTPITGNNGANDMGGFTIGSQPTGAAWSNIQVKEAAVFATGHDADTRALMRSHLNSL